MFIKTHPLPLQPFPSKSIISLSLSLVCEIFSHGSKQQHNSDSKLHNLPKFHPRHRRRNLAGFKAWQRVHPASPVAGGGSRRPPPPRLSRRLRRCLLEPPWSLGCLPILHGRPHYPPSHCSYHRLHRHSPRGRHPSRRRNTLPGV